MAASTTSPLPNPTSPARITVLISGSGTNLQALINACTTSTTTAVSQPTHDTSSAPTINATVVRVISNKKSAYGLTRAANANIPTAYHNLIAGGYTKRFPHSQPSSSPPLPTSSISTTEKASASPAARAAYDADLAALILQDKPDLVVCAGFMHILSPAFLAPLEDRKPWRLPVINLHPALPGAYNGIDAIGRAWRDFQARGDTAGMGTMEGEGVSNTGVMVHYVIEAVDMGDVICQREVELRKGESLEGLEARMHEAEHEVIVAGSALAVRGIWSERQYQASSEGG